MTAQYRYISKEVIDTLYHILMAEYQEEERFYIEQPSAYRRERMERMKIAREWLLGAKSNGLIEFPEEFNPEEFTV